MTPTIRRRKGDRCEPGCECYRHSAEFRAKVAAANLRRERRPVADRFWEKVAIRSTKECWPWLASGRPSGRGQFQLFGRMRNAPQVAWELTNGPIPPGLCVLHSCDNPPCVNPAHLWLGTQTDNMADMVAKGRHYMCRAKRRAT